jgi:hypothetical protein
MMFSTLKHLWIEHPSTDLAFFVAATAISWRAGVGQAFADGGRLDTYLVSVATTAGLVMAAATFVCAMTYQAHSDLMRRLRKKFGRSVAANWSVIISATLLASIGSTLLLLVSSGSAWVSATGVGLLAVVAIEGARIVWWLRSILLLEDVSPDHEDRATPKNPRYLVRR